MHIIIPEVALKWLNTKKAIGKKSTFSVYRLKFGVITASRVQLKEFPLYGTDNYYKMVGEKINAEGFLLGRGISV